LSEEQPFVPTINVKGSEEVKKPRLGAILFCEYATMTEKGTYVFAGCFERFVFGKDEPKVTSNFFLYVRASETREGDFQVAIIDPNDTPIMAFKYDIESSGFMLNVPASVHFAQRIKFPVAVEGTYWVDVSFNGESLGGAPLLVEFTKEEASEDEHKV
jgi:hypothetical protein